jgi:TPR repeat protein
LLSSNLAALGAPLEDGDSAFQIGDVLTAANLYRAVAIQGEPLAQFRLGVLYEEGKGTEKGSREAIRWYLVASAQGFSDATYNLARLYHDGRGIPQNHVRARRWYGVAAKQGYLKALVNLGVMNAVGEGGPRKRGNCSQSQPNAVMRPPRIISAPCTLMGLVCREICCGRICGST